MIGPPKNMGLPGELLQVIAQNLSPEAVLLLRGVNSKWMIWLMKEAFRRPILSRWDHKRPKTDLPVSVCLDHIHKLPLIPATTMRLALINAFDRDISSLHAFQYLRFVEVVGPSVYSHFCVTHLPSTVVHLKLKHIGIKGTPPVTLKLVQLVRCFVELCSSNFLSFQGRIEATACNDIELRDATHVLMDGCESTPGRRDELQERRFPYFERIKCPDYFNYYGVVHRAPSLPHSAPGLRLAIITQDNFTGDIIDYPDLQYLILAGEMKTHRMLRTLHAPKLEAICFLREYPWLVSLFTPVQDADLRRRYAHVYQAFGCIGITRAVEKPLIVKQNQHLILRLLKHSSRFQTVDLREFWLPPECPV